MKKSPLVLSIIGSILVAASIALLCLIPQIGGDLANYVPADFFGTMFSNLIPTVKGTVMFGIGNPIYSGIIVGLLAVVLIFWLWHFIMLCATRRANSLPVNLLWLIFGIGASFVALVYLGHVDPNTSYLIADTAASPTFTDGMGLLIVLIQAGFMANLMAILYVGGIIVLAGVGYILLLIGVIGAIHDDRKNPNEKLEDDPIEVTETEEDPENKEEEAPAAEEGKEEKKDDEAKPLIVQNITYSGTANNPQPQQPQYPYPPYPYAPYPYPYPPMPPKEEPKFKAFTEDDIRRIVSEAVANEQKAILDELNKKEEPAPAAVAPAPVAEPAPVEEKKEAVQVEERPLTAKELRAIIKNELRDHDHPEELLPLTDEQCRALIRDELDEYYASTRPSTEKVEEVKEEPKEEAAPEEDFMTADELSKMIRNEVVQVLSEKPEEEKLTLDMVKAAIKEEVSSLNNKDAASKEEVEESVKNGLASFQEEQKKQDELISATKEQAFLAEYEAKLQAAKNEAAIEKLKNSQLTADDIRNILADELDKRLANLEAKKAEEPVPAPTPAVAPKEPEVVVPAPVAEPAENAEEKAARIPFAERLMSLDDDVKEDYNELKAEALSYGLKSRLSISGDTFRLHTKTYLKIVVAGKGLKLYMALDPHDYKDSTIPVKDAGVKNLYKDIPLVFKVKSSLSVKRAKALIKDVCEKDGLQKQEIIPLNYVSQLASYKVAGTETEEDE